jgi:hypothetical protein
LCRCLLLRSRLLLLLCGLLLLLLASATSRLPAASPTAAPVAALYSRAAFAISPTTAPAVPPRHLSHAHRAQGLGLLGGAAAQGLAQKTPH